MLREECAPAERGRTQVSCPNPSALALGRHARRGRRAMWRSEPGTASRSQRSQAHREGRPEHQALRMPRTAARGARLVSAEVNVRGQRSFQPVSDHRGKTAVKIHGCRTDAMSRSAKQSHRAASADDRKEKA